MACGGIHSRERVCQSEYVHLSGLDFHPIGSGHRLAVNQHIHRFRNGSLAAVVGHHYLYGEFLARSYADGSRKALKREVMHGNLPYADIVNRGESMGLAGSFYPTYHHVVGIFAEVYGDLVPSGKAIAEVIYRPGGAKRMPFAVAVREDLEFKKIFSLAV